jgi:hypothetical protein
MPLGRREPALYKAWMQKREVCFGRRFCFERHCALCWLGQIGQSSLGQYWAAETEFFRNLGLSLAFAGISKTPRTDRGFCAFYHHKRCKTTEFSTKRPEKKGRYEVFGMVPEIGIEPTTYALRMRGYNCGTSRGFGALR